LFFLFFSHFFFVFVFEAGVFS